MNNNLHSKFIFFFLVFLFSAGCTKDPLKEAFNGEYSSGKNNEIINEYCQSCHVHSHFLPDEHIDEMNVVYSKRLFQVTSECRICHYLDENIFGDVLRKHRRPNQVKRGKFRKFIQEESAKKRERRKAEK